MGHRGTGSALAGWVRGSAVLFFLGVVAGCAGGGNGADTGLPDGFDPGGTDQTGEGPRTDAVCPIGSDGCPCATGGTCGVTSWGEALSCTDGVCKATSCPAGTTGCACRDGAACDAEGDTCADGHCRPVECPAGQANCACAGGACAPGLTCRDGTVCVDGTGWPQGPCYSDGTCRSGNRCQGGFCVPCTRGSEACSCRDDGTCHPGLACANGQCADADTVVVPPSDARCYTPCSRDLVLDDGTYRPCGVDGLLEGCVGGLGCTDGSCTVPGRPAPTCAGDVDCPPFQACLAGRCYSNCTTNGDCTNGRVCHLRVCRPACDLAGGSPCPAGSTCESADGVLGTCMPTKNPGAVRQMVVAGTFSLDVVALDLSNVRTGGQVVITNLSPAREKFTLRKRQHARYKADGTVETLDDPSGDGVDCDPARDCPLTWLKIGSNGDNQVVQSVEVGVDGNGGTATLTFEGAAGAGVPRWEGVLEVVHAKLGVGQVALEYVELPEGRWVGTLQYFANFGDEGLPAWSATPETRKNPTLLAQVGNALVQRWGAFRTGNLSWQEFLAVLKSTEAQSWRWANVKADCPARGGACYPYDSSTLGLSVYTSDLLSRPVPTGVSELPFAVNLRLPDATGRPAHLAGLIDSSYALQYPGNPSVALDLGASPSGCQFTSGGNCLVFVDALDADVFLGGHYETDSKDTACARRPGAGFQPVKTPWLVPGFERATEADADTGLRYRYDCRDTRLPWGDGAAATPTDAVAKRNLSLVRANPVPDGRDRRRSIELIDGALVNQRDLFLIFRETYPSFLPDDTTPFSAYGYVLLQRAAADLDLEDDDADGVPNAYDGSRPADARTEPTGILDGQCAASLVEKALGAGNTTVTADNAARLVVALVDGRVPDGTPQVVTDGSGEAAHYLCVDTGDFDGGPADTSEPGQPLGLPQNDGCGYADPARNRYDANGSCDDGGPGAKTSICPLGTDMTDCPDRTLADTQARVACPAGSDVIFFTVDGTMTQKKIAELPCQASSGKGTCAATLEGWRGTSGSPLVQYRPAWRCRDANAVFCDSNRLDLREGKDFFQASDAQAVFQPLVADIDLAFRYKTKFRDREGQGIGFAPQACAAGSDQIPYCYDPPAIEADRARTDCLLYVWDRFYDSVQPGSVAGTDARKRLDDALCTSYSYVEACHAGMPATTVPHDGFERLYAELLVMLGDESYTRAFAARFDLANSSAVSFEGTLFETGGINLSGGAGYEMHLLYQAAQYYQEALDRFYTQSPRLWKALQYGFSGRNFVTQETVTWYFERLVRASTQKSRAWSQVAQRYQNLDRPDLARAVIERAYTATYLEGILLSQLMRRITDTLKPEDRAQVWQVLEDGQRRYHTALLDMRNSYRSITDEVSWFGLPPDYVPFPVTFGLEQNAFELLLGRAQQRVDTAKYKEDLAIDRNRAFETETAEFQSELVRLRNTYEDQIGQTCGTMEGTDGRIYPAIPRYAYLNERARLYGDPCGMMGNGAIHGAMGQLEQMGIALRKVRQQMDDVFSEVGIEKSRVEAQCNLTLALADFVYRQGQKTMRLNEAIAGARLAQSGIDRAIGMITTSTGLSKCSPLTGECVTAIVSLGAYLGSVGVLNGVALGIEGGILAMQHEISETELDSAKWQTESQCDAALIDSNARTATMLLQVKNLQLDALQAQHQVQLAVGDIQAQVNQSKRLQDQLAEAEQLSIDVQAARDDPNVRIYKDDAMVNADETFHAALQEVYRATRVFEYYTSQSYADLEKLFLVRTVQYGDYNLEMYLRNLEDAYYDFEEAYGIPSTRVAILSLRDDILRIPRLADDGTAIAQTDRIDRMRARLRDPSLLDGNGYLTIPFSTSIADLSPVTRDHKIAWLEAEVIGSAVGDTLGRIYVRQDGTSTVSSLSGDRLYYRFPERLAVVNPFFNGNRVLAQDVYKNQDFRDRPYLNTAWELVINQRDEKVNQDLDLQSLTDVRLYVYYTDFVGY